MLLLLNSAVALENLVDHLGSGVENVGFDARLADAVPLVVDQADQLVTHFVCCYSVVFGHFSIKLNNQSSQ